MTGYETNRREFVNEYAELFMQGISILGSEGDIPLEKIKVLRSFLADGYYAFTEKYARKKEKLQDRGGMDGGSGGAVWSKFLAYPPCLIISRYGAMIKHGKETTRLDRYLQRMAFLGRGCGQKRKVYNSDGSELGRPERHSYNRQWEPPPVSTFQGGYPEIPPERPPRAALAEKRGDQKP
jgi:hypothetical protein